MVCFLNLHEILTMLNTVGQNQNLRPSCRHQKKSGVIVGVLMSIALSVKTLWEGGGG